MYHLIPHEEPIHTIYCGYFLESLAERIIVLQPECIYFLMEPYLVESRLDRC